MTAKRNWLLKTIKEHSRPAIEAGENALKIKKKKFDLQLIGNREANNFRKLKQKLDRHMKKAHMDPDSICSACHTFFFNVCKEKRQILVRQLKAANRVNNSTPQ